MAAIVTVLGLWAVAGATLLLHALLGIPGTYLGQGYPLTRGLTVTYASLAIEAAIGTLPCLIVAALSVWLRLRWLALPLLAAAWLWGLAFHIDPFKIAFGTTWALTEPLIGLALHPVHTPLALAVVLLSTFVLLSLTAPTRH